MKNGVSRLRVCRHAGQIGSGGGSGSPSVVAGQGVGLAAVLDADPARARLAVEAHEVHPGARRSARATSRWRGRRPRPPRRGASRASSVQPSRRAVANGSGGSSTSRKRSVQRSISACQSRPLPLGADQSSTKSTTRRAVDQAGLVAAAQQLGDRRAPVVAVVEGAVVDVHADEAVGQVAVEPAAELLGVGAAPRRGAPGRRRCSRAAAATGAAACRPRRGRGARRWRRAAAAGRR